MTAPVDVLAVLTARVADMESRVLFGRDVAGRNALDAVDELIAERDALRDALIGAEARLSILIDNDRHKLLDVLARDDARIALARVGGAK
jgi:hypothetical protein